MAAKGKAVSRDCIDMYVIKCCECEKWRIIPTKEEFETIRQTFSSEPWFCSKKPNCSCEHPEDIKYDSSRIWVIERPNIPKPPPETERLVKMRANMSRMDAYYVMPNGKRARGHKDVEKFLKENPQYNATLLPSSFSFATPKIVKETVSKSSEWAIAKAKREGRKEQDKINIPSNNNN